MQRGGFDGRWSVRAGTSAVRLAFSEVSRRLYFTDSQSGSINVVDVRRSDTSPRPLVTGLSSPLPITAHPHHRYDTPPPRLTSRFCRHSAWILQHIETHEMAEIAGVDNGCNLN